MSERQTQQGKSAGNSILQRSSSGLLQRKCDSCGQHTIAGGTCGSCEKPQGMLQRKLMIGASNDPLELEADRVADQVMAGPAHSAVNEAPPSIQRFTGQGGGEMDMAPSSVERVLASSGTPLQPALRRNMERRFGYDFSHVRIHTDARAIESAHNIGAEAYAVGADIVFGESRYNPQSQEGKCLIAHELTHVVQQSFGAAPSVQRQPVALADDLDGVQNGDINEEGEPIDDSASFDDVVDAESDVNEMNEDQDSLALTSGKPINVGARRIVVKLPSTLLRFEGGKQISSWVVSAGRPTNPTPRGSSFTINFRDENHRSNSYGLCGTRRVGPGGAANCKNDEKYVGADMGFFQRFAPSVGFHRGNTNVLSHGCIHVAPRQAAMLWKWSTYGTPVEVK